MGRGVQAPRKSTPATNGEAETNGVLDAKLQAIKDGPMRSELKHLDRKVTEQGKQYYVETVEDDVPDQIDWNSKYALCIVRHFRHKDQKFPDRTALQVNSEHLKEILEKTVVDFPGQSFATKTIEINQPYRVLFHYRHELEAAGKEFESDSQAAEHLRLLIDFINEEFADTIAEVDNLLPQGRVSYHNLWTIFRPGSTVYGPVFGQPRAFKLTNYNYGCNPPAFQLHVSYVDFDGNKFGTTATQRMIGAFAGDEKIASLPTLPLHFHPSASEVRKQLVSRGKKFEHYAGMRFACYKGIGLEHDGCKINRYFVDGRVVVDTKTSHRLNGNNAFSVTAFAEDLDPTQKLASAAAKADTANGHAMDVDSEDEDLYDEDDYYEDDDAEDENEVTSNEQLMPETRSKPKPLKDDQRLLTNSMVRGFSFSEKRWLDFFLEGLTPVDWNPNCFDQLVLPTAQKDLVRALVTTHAAEKKQGAFDDIVKGKGKGLIMVLHGPPGVGKTLTAETVAEYTKRPLYMVSSGDLGTYSSQLDEQLSRILDMASTWRCVLLIDEADVFLERRSLHDMERNSLVSIFLRVLEYYEGILFLTSNRVSTFDDAFKSRIHVPLKYNDLTAESRKQIWKNFLRKMEGEVDIDEEGYDSLASTGLNGRQIKNVIRTAKSLAKFHGQKLDRAKLEQVIGIQLEFERELDLMNAEGGTMVNGH